MPLSPPKLFSVSPCLRGAFLCLTLLYGAVGALAGEVVFVRGGVAIDLAGDVEVRHDDAVLTTNEIALAGGRRIVEFDWQPRAQYELLIGGERRSLHAPLKPAPYLVQSIPLEDVGQAAIGGVSPDGVVRFSPDGRRLAIGTFGGWLRVVDSYTGEVLHRRRIAEGMVKTLAWSPDGALLYVGEQSPDALLLALDAAPRVGRPPTFDVVWSARLADWIESSRPSAGDRYAIYSLPAVFDLKVAADGRVFAAGAHGWSVDGEPRNRSVVCCFAPDGGPLWRQPSEGAHPVVIRHFALDAAGRRVLLLANQTQPAAADDSLRPDTLYLLDGRTGRIAAEQRIEPLRPHFDRVDAWDSVALSADAAEAAIGLSDGRGLIFDTTSDVGLSPLVQLDLATPLVVGTTPVAAAASYTQCVGDLLVWQTQNTHIPFGSAQTANQAPSAHRGANTLTVTDLAGRALWKYRGPFALSGAWSDGVGTDGRPRWLAVACRELPGAAEPGQYGLLLFDLRQEGGGADRLTYYYPTAGPVLAAADVGPDGRLLAIIETPAPTPDGQELFGTHRVHVVR